MTIFEILNMVARKWCYVHYFEIQNVLATSRDHETVIYAINCSGKFHLNMCFVVVSEMASLARRRWRLFLLSLCTMPDIKMIGGSR